MTFVPHASVACPKCGAEPAVACLSGRYKKAVRPHRERIAAWQGSLRGETSLRGLAEALYTLAKDHPCYSQVYSVVQNCVDHICAIAKANEANRDA